MSPGWTASRLNQRKVADFWFFVLTDGFIHYPLNNRMIASVKINAKHSQAKEPEGEYKKIVELNN